MQQNDKMGSTETSFHDDRPSVRSPYFYLFAGTALIFLYFIMARDLRFFVPRDFTYVEGPFDLVPITHDLSRSWLRHFSPSFAASLFWKLVLLFPASLFLVIFTIKRLSPKTVRDIHENIAKISPVLLITCFCLFAFAVIFLNIVFVFDGNYITDDENAYVMQAKIIEGGHIFAPEPPVEKSFGNWFIITNGVFTGKYTIGYPVLLAIGNIITGVYYAAPVLFSLLTIILVYFTGKKLFDRKTALLAAFFLAVSPFFLVNSATLLSHSTSLFFLALFAWLFFTGLEKKEPLAIICGLAAGAAIGMAFNIRQLTAMGFGFPFALWLIWLLFRKKWNRLLFIIPCGAGFAVFLIFTIWYNLKISGSPFTFPFNVYDPTERIGFGAMLTNLRYTHTPFRGFQNFIVSFFRYNQWFLGMPVSFIFLFPFFFKRRFSTGTRWCLAISGSFILAYMFYYSPGIPDTGPVYYFELLLPVTLLSARGVMILYEWLRRNESLRNGALLTAFIGISIILAWISFVPERMLHLNAMAEKIGEPYEVVGNGVDKPALVFIRTLPRVGWVFGYRNPDPYLEGPVIYARDLGPEKNLEVIDHFPGRNYYILYYDTEANRSRIRTFTKEDLHKVMQSEP